jgi:hypothetical protein
MNFDRCVSSAARACGARVAARRARHGAAHAVRVGRRACVERAGAYEHVRDRVKYSKNDFKTALATVFEAKSTE